MGATPLITVLVVDDDADMRLLARHMIDRSGLGLQVIEEAVDGPEALETLTRILPPPAPTVVVLDNRMPGLTGLEVAAQVLALVPTQLIILFSAQLTKADEQKALALGVAACLPKNRIDQLPRLIQQLAQAAEP